MTADAVEAFVDRMPGRPDVRGFLHRPRVPGDDGIVLTHGAGSDAGSPLLVALAAAFADAGLVALRCTLPFRQARPTGPPSPRGAPTDRVGLRAAVHAVRGLAHRVVLGGHSYGGRQATLLAAEEPALAAALLLLAYPLHPPARPGDLRTAHFPLIRTPALFVHGEHDPFGSPGELRSAIAAIPAPVRLLSVGGAGHDLGRGRRTSDAVPALVASVVRELLAMLGPARTGPPAR